LNIDSEEEKSEASLMSKNGQDGQNDLGVNSDDYNFDSQTPSKKSEKKQQNYLIDAPPKLGTAQKSSNNLSNHESEEDLNGLDVNKEIAYTNIDLEVQSNHLRSINRSKNPTENGLSSDDPTDT
jgi:hypothetical protein